MTAKVASTYGYDASETTLLPVEPIHDILPQDGNLRRIAPDVAVSVRLHGSLQAVVVAARDATATIHMHAMQDAADPASAHNITITVNLTAAFDPR